MIISQPVLDHIERIITLDSYFEIMNGHLVLDLIIATHIKKTHHGLLPKVHSFVVEVLDERIQIAGGNATKSNRSSNPLIKHPLQSLNFAGELHLVCLKLLDFHLDASDQLVDYSLLQMRLQMHIVIKKVGSDLLLFLGVVALEFQAQDLIEIIPKFVVHDVQLFALNQSPVNVDCVKVPKFTLELRCKYWVGVRNVDEPVLSDGQTFDGTTAPIVKLKSLTKHNLEPSEY